MESLKNSPHDAVQSIVSAAQAAADALDSRDEKIAQLRKQRDGLLNEVARFADEAGRVLVQRDEARAERDKLRKERDGAREEIRWLRQTESPTVPRVTAPHPEQELWNPQCDDVGIVTCFCGEELPSPVAARFGGAHWFRMDGECWPAGNRGARPDEVTVRRGKVVSP